MKSSETEGGKTECRRRKNRKDRVKVTKRRLYEKIYGSVEVVVVRQWDSDYTIRNKYTEIVLDTLLKYRKNK